MIYGTTYSYKYMEEYFRLPFVPAFRDISGLGFDIVRLATYWSDSEKSKGKYDLAKIRALLEVAEDRGQDIVLTAGMKAPRWPEFHLPDWLNDQSATEVEKRLHEYLGHLVLALKGYRCIRYWQVENEPLDPSGPHGASIGKGILEKEVALVRALDPDRKVIITLWGNDLARRGHMPFAEKLADIVGLDLYYKIPGRKGYKGPSVSDTYLKKAIAVSARPVWVTELQTNPWKVYRAGTHLELFEENLFRALALGPAAILFWGSEYWFGQKKKGAVLLWNRIGELARGK